MRSIPFLTWAILGLAMSCSSCDKEDDKKNNNNNLPDLVFQAEISGALDHTIDFTLTGNVAMAGVGYMNGSMNSTIKVLSILAQESPQWMLGFVLNNTDDLSTGTYTLDVANGDIGSFSDMTLAPAGYTATSGNVKLNKVELFQGVGSGIGGANDYFIDGEFSMVLQDNSTPSDQINMSGTFSGVNIKTN